MLTSGLGFHKGLECVSLRTLTFTCRFHHCTESVAMPSCLKIWIFADEFNQGLEGAMLTGSLQALTFGWDFSQSMEGVILPISLRGPPELGKGRAPKQPADIDLWLCVGPGPGRTHAAERPAVIVALLSSLQTLRC